MKSRVIRTGQSKSHSGITAREVKCLRHFWELEEQLGLRAKPNDDVMKHIPRIQVRAPLAPQNEVKGDSDETG